jgi:hypothetical protein
LFHGKGSLLEGDEIMDIPQKRKQRKFARNLTIGSFVIGWLIGWFVLAQDGIYTAILSMISRHFLDILGLFFALVIGLVCWRTL